MNFWTRWLFVVCVFVVGCNSKPATPTADSSEDGGAAVPSADGKRAKKSMVPVRRNVKDIVGNWVIVVTSKRNDSYRWIVNFSRQADGKIVGELVDTSQDKDEHDKPHIESTEVDGDAIRFVFKNPHGSFDFVGALQQGFIRGTLKFSPGELLLTRLLPTDEKSLEKFEVMGLPPGGGEFESLFKSKDTTPEQILAVLREYKVSPLAQDVYSMLMQAHVQAGFDEKKVKELIDGFLSSAKVWGNRWVARIEMTIAVGLINGRQFSHLAMPHLDAAEKLFGEDLDAVKESLKAYRDGATISVDINQIMSVTSTDEAKAAAATALTEFLKTQPFNLEIIYALATQAEKTGQVDQAIEYFSDIVALPMMEATIKRSQGDQPPNPPNERLKKLWAQKHGSEDGYDQHISDVYRTKIEAFLTEMQQKAGAIPAADASNKTVFVEFFTGTQCPPCVPADLALNAISKSFPTSEVIVVRYHQHIPAPDGLTNPDSEERMAFYSLSSVPAIVIDGSVINPRFYAGPIQVAENGYSVLRQVIDPKLSEKNEVAINLSATVTDGQLMAMAEVTGVSEELLPSCRLRLAIVENNVFAFVPLGSNGIRNHEYVVREILGGAKGIPPKKGELKYTISMPVAELQQHVVDHITRFEAGRRIEIPPAMKPNIRGPISLVAWVQNGTVNKETQSMQVLQSAMVPVIGETGFDARMKAEAASPVPANQTKLESGAGKTDLDLFPLPPALPE